MKSRVNRLLKGVFRSQTVELFPIRLSFFKKYCLENLREDLLTGLNISLLAFPFGIAYAALTGLPIKYGIFATVIGAILSAIFSGSRFASIGPTSATAVLLMGLLSTFQFQPEQIPIYIAILLFMVGILLILGAYFNVAQYMQYISKSVIFGYITAAAILVFFNQLRTIMGVEIKSDGFMTFFDMCRLTFLQVKNTNFIVLGISFLSAICYLLLKKYLPKLPTIAFVLIICGIIGFFSIKYGFEIPCLQAISISEWNVTFPKLSFDAINMVANTALAIVFFGLIDCMSLSTLAIRFGEKVNLNQIIYSLGISNLFCGFFSGTAVSGALLRSTITSENPKQTFVSGIFNGLFCIMGAFLLGSLVRWVPKATLSVIIMFLSLSLINMKALKTVVRSTGSDALVFFTTLISALLFPLSTAIFIGTLISVILFLKKAAVPEMTEYFFDESGTLSELPGDISRPISEVSIVHIEGNLFFASSDLFRNQIRNICEKDQLKVIILKMRNAHLIDATCIMALEELAKYIHLKERHLLLSEVRPSIMSIFKRSGLLNTIEEDHIFADHPKNPTLSTAKALKKAQLLVGKSKVSIRILATQANAINNSAYNKIVKINNRKVSNPEE